MAFGFSCFCKFNLKSLKKAVFLSGDDFLVKKLNSIMNHVLVPIHEIVSEEESIDIIKKFGTKKEKFPQILLSDPVIEELGAKKGDLVKITRETPTAGKSIYYRIVVK